MRSLRVLLFLPLAILLLSSAVISRQNDCLETLKHIFSKMELTQLPKEDKVYHFDYTITTRIRNRDQEAPASSRVKVYLSSRLVEIISGQMEVYKDRKHAFTVIPYRHLIYWGDSDLGRNDSDSIQGGQSTAVLKAGVFDHCTLKYCKEVSGEDYDREIFLEPDANLKKSSKIAGVQFYASFKKQSIVRTVIHYTKESEQEQIDITYHQVSYDYQKFRADHSARSKIFNADGTLLPRYKGYKVTDVRANTK